MLKIIAISDTHTMHGHLWKKEVPKADVLIHAGDFGGHGTIQDCIAFGSWINKIKSNFKHVVIIPGNHDRLFEIDPAIARTAFHKDVHVLIDEAVTLDGVKFYGSPYTPEFCAWAFQLYGQEQRAAKWAQIPDDTNVLITHGPPRYVLDRLDEVLHMPGGKVLERTQYLGDGDLRDRIPQLKQLKLHVFGHIHNGYGTLIQDGVQYVNASICTEQYKPTNVPIEVNI